MLPKAFKLKFWVRHFVQTSIADYAVADELVMS